MSVYIVIEVQDGKIQDSPTSIRIVTEEGTPAPSCWLELTGILDRARENSPSFKNIPSHTVPIKEVEPSGTSGG